MRILLLVPFVALAACLPHPPPAPPPGEVIPGSTDVALSRLAPRAVAAYPGTYRGEGGTIVIRRADGALFADRGGASLPLKVIGLGTFADPGGTTYLFVPADGSGGRLRTIAPDGTARDWTR